MNQPQDWYKTKEQAEGYQEFQKSYMGPSRFLCLQLAGRKIGTSPLRILDLGCGTGAAVPMLRELFPEAKITGVDIEPEMLDVAKRLYEDSNIEFLEGSSQKFPYEIGEFDFIFSFSSFRLWDNPVLCLKEIQKHLSANGLAYIADLRKDISSQIQSEALKKTRDFKSLVEEQIESAYTIDEVENLLDKADINDYLIYDQPFSVLFQNRVQQKRITEKLAEFTMDSDALNAKQNLHSMLYHLFIYPENHE